MKYKWFFNKYSQYEILDQTEDWLYCKKKANLQVNFEKNFWDAYLNKNKAQYGLTLEIFQSCPFLHKIFKNYTVKYIILSGSGLYNIIDNISDYDLDIFIKEPVEEIENNNDNECLFYKGRKLHWYYHNFNKIINNDQNNLLYKAELYFLSDKNILYGNATELLQVAEKNKLMWVTDFLKFNYYNIININDIKNKKIAYYILFYFVAKKQTIDVELITKIKRSYYIELMEDDKNKINLLLNQLKNYCEEELKCQEHQ